MPRKPRIHVPGGLYHVILRGNNRQAIFCDDGDRHRWMRLLEMGIERYRCRIHAYCWMTNHVHLAVQVSDLPLGAMIRWVASQYSRSTNKRLEKTGHLFERRYRGRLVDTDGYLLQLVRYIHRNPVAASLVDDPAHYPWSSHHAYLGFYRPALLTTDWVLSCFGERRKQAIAAYRNFMAEEGATRHKLPDAAWLDDQTLGDDDFAAATRHTAPSARDAPSLSRLIREICARHGIDEGELASPRRTHRNSRVRAEIALAAQQRGVAGLADVARHFNRSASSLSHAVRYLLDSGKAAEK